MNIPQAIFDYLKLNPSVSVEDFGTFSLANSGAVVNSESGVILPPAKQIIHQSDYNVSDKGFLSFLAENHYVSVSEAKQALNNQTEFWKKKIETGEAFDMAPLGRFRQSGEQLEFIGTRVSSDNPDFYGLEEIKLSEIHKNGRVQTDEGDYRMNKSILYTFLVALPMLGILAAVIWKRDILFGKKSFDNLSVKTSTHRIEDDSLKQKKVVADSLKTDSLKQDSLKAAPVPAVKKYTGAKKWSGKKYKTSKWTRKKRANHSR